MTLVDTRLTAQYISEEVRLLGALNFLTKRVAWARHDQIHCKKCGALFNEAARESDGQKRFSVVDFECGSTRRQ